MQADGLRDSTLVLIGHGATQNRDSAAPVIAHAERLRARGIFREVLDCYWMVEPRLTDVWPRIGTRTVYFVPVTISEGYFTTDVIPSRLGLRPEPEYLAGLGQEVRGHWAHYCPPIGSHPAMTDVLLTRVRGVLEEHPDTPPVVLAATALFIAGHGTARNPQSRAAVDRQVDRIRARGEFGEVHAAFMQEPPFIADCWKATTARDLVMVPFFISNGLHTAEDIPVLLGESAATVRERLRRGEPGWANPMRCGCRRLWFTPALGADPLLTDIVLERVRESRATGDR